MWLFVTGQAFAEIRGSVDARGFFHFPGPKSGRAAKASKSSPAVEKIIEEASGKYKVEKGLVKAVIRAESNFDAAAVSVRGAQGLMQLMPSTASWMEVNDPFSPAENIHAGTKYLGMMLRRFKGDKVLALAAYNAGPEKVEIYRGVPPFPETHSFIRRVLDYCKAYGLKD